MSVETRQKIERKIVSAVVRMGLVHGYTIGVWDGEEMCCVSTDYKTIMKAMFSVDDERLYFSVDNGRTWKGWVRLIYGNDGWDVISDCTVNMTDILTEANIISNRYADSL